MQLFENSYLYILILKGHDSSIHGSSLLPHCSHPSVLRGENVLTSPQHIPQLIYLDIISGSCHLPAIEAENAYQQNHRTQDHDTNGNHYLQGVFKDLVHGWQSSACSRDVCKESELPGYLKSTGFEVLHQCNRKKQSSKKQSLQPKKKMQGNYFKARNYPTYQYTLLIIAL